MSTRNFRVKNGIDIGSAVTIDGSSGIITATTFIGDGSGLSNVTSTGSGIEIKDAGATVGVAATIEFGANIDVTPLSAGIVTVTAPDQGISGIDTTTTSFFNDVQIGGAVTATTFIGDGSGLTGVVGSGSGVVVEEDGTTVGTAGTINFVNLTVSPISAGIVTVSTQSADNFTAGSLNVTGVSTFGGESNFNDNINISTGSTAIFGSDLLVYRQPTGDQNSVVAYKGSNDFEIHSDEITLRDSDDSRSIARFSEGSTTFYGLGFPLMNLSNNNVTTYTSLVVNGGITASGNGHSFGSGSQLTFTFGTKNQIKSIQSKDFEISNTYPGKKLELTAQGGVELSSFNNGTPSPLLRADTGIEVLGISTFTNSVNLNDGATIPEGESLDFGTDFSISRFSNQNKARIQYTGPGDFTFEIDDVDFRNSANNETLMTLRNGGGVSLYYNNNIKLSSTNTGVTVSGDLTASGLSLPTLTDITDAFGVSNTLNFGGDMSIFHMQDPLHGTTNRIVVDENNLIIGTKGESSGNTYYNSLISLDVGNDLGFTDGNNAFVILGFGTAGPRLTTEDAGVSIGGTVRLTGGLTLETNNTTIVGFQEALDKLNKLVVFHSIMMEVLGESLFFLVEHLLLNQQILIGIMLSSDQLLILTLLMQSLEQHQLIRVLILVSLVLQLRLELVLLGTLVEQSLVLEYHSHIDQNMTSLDLGRLNSGHIMINSQIILTQVLYLKFQLLMALQTGLSVFITMVAVSSGTGPMKIVR